MVQIIETRLLASFTKYKYLSNNRSFKKFLFFPGNIWVLLLYFEHVYIHCVQMDFRLYIHVACVGFPVSNHGDSY